MSLSIETRRGVIGLMILKMLNDPDAATLGEIDDLTIQLRQWRLDR